MAVNLLTIDFTKTLKNAEASCDFIYIQTLCSYNIFRHISQFCLHVSVISP